MRQKPKSKIEDVSSASNPIKNQMITLDKKRKKRRKKRPNLCCLQICFCRFSRQVPSTALGRKPQSSVRPMSDALTDWVPLSRCALLFFKVLCLRYLGLLPPPLGACTLMTLATHSLCLIHIFLLNSLKLPQTSSLSPQNQTQSPV